MTGATAGMVWRTARGTITTDRPLVSAILNLTPDSFWSASRQADAASALAAAEQALEAGADLLDVGGESTRPGAAPVAEAEERARVLPFIREAARRWPAVPLSVDTVKSTVADAVLAEGAWIVNDVSGLRLDVELGAVVARHGAGLVLMHSRGSVDRMASYELADYDGDPVGGVRSELEAALERARAAGVAPDRVVLDPGLGFAKRTTDSVALLSRLDRILELGRPVMVGPSRKRFIGELGGGLPAEARLEGTLAACVAALFGGARIFRVHDPGPVRRALDVAAALGAAIPER
jgi:dihydropteroate synthase